MKIKLTAKTLNLTPAIAQTPLCALIILTVIYICAETSVRFTVRQTDALIPSVGSNHYEFEYNLVAIQKLKSDEGRVDCVFMGSSMPDLAIDPQIVMEAFKSTTNQDLVCYNFSLNGAKAYTVGKLSRIIVEDVQPLFIIYGLSARDFTKLTQPDPVVDTPWMKYRWGEESFSGWLTENSFLYRLYLRYRFSEQTADQPPATRYTGVGRYGYNQYFEQVTQAALSQPVKVTYPDYAVDPTNLEGLQELLDLRSTGVQIILIEMPVQTSYFQAFSDGQRSYQKFVDAVKNLDTTRPVPFWQMADQPAIPLEGWRDRFHLNNSGAIIFSTWLGHKLGAAVMNGQADK